MYLRIFLDYITKYRGIFTIFIYAHIVNVLKLYLYIYIYTLSYVYECVYIIGIYKQSSCKQPPLTAAGTSNTIYKHIICLYIRIYIHILGEKIDKSTHTHTHARIYAQRDNTHRRAKTGRKWKYSKKIL